MTARARRAVGILVGTLVLAGMGCTGRADEESLCRAIRARDVDGVRTLLEGGVDPNASVVFSGNVTTPFRVAVQALVDRDDAETIVLALLAAGGDPDTSWMSVTADDPGRAETFYALGAAARAGRPAVVEALLEAGARAGGEPGGEALIEAALRNDVPSLEALVESGAPVDYKDTWGRTPLWAAVDAVARDAIDFLEERGAKEW